MLPGFWSELFFIMLRLIYSLSVITFSCLIARSIFEIWPIMERWTGSVSLGIASSFFIFFALRFLISFVTKMKKTHLSLWFGLWGGPAIVLWDMHYIIPNWRFWTIRGFANTVLISIFFIFCFIMCNFLAKWLGHATRRLFQGKD